MRARKGGDLGSAMQAVQAAPLPHCSRRVEVFLTLAPRSQALNGLLSRPAGSERPGVRLRARHGEGAIGMAASPAR